MPGFTPTNIIWRLGPSSSVRRFLGRDGEAGDADEAVDTLRSLEEGVFRGDGVLTERLSARRGEGERLTGGGKTGCLEIAADFKLEALEDRVARLFGGGDRSPSPGAFRLIGDGEGDWYSNSRRLSLKA